MLRKKIKTGNQQITKSCTNIKELLDSEDAKKVIMTILKDRPLYNSDEILALFSKLNTLKVLDDTTITDISNFIRDKIIIEVVNKIFTKLGIIPMGPITYHNIEHANTSLGFITSVIGYDKKEGEKHVFITTLLEELIQSKSQQNNQKNTSKDTT